MVYLFLYTTSSEYTVDPVLLSYDLRLSAIRDSYAAGLLPGHRYSG